MVKTSLFCLHKLSQRDRCLFLRFLAKTKNIDKFMFEIKSANSLALGTRRSFIESGYCPVSNRAEQIVGDAFPWDYTKDGNGYWNRINNQWKTFLFIKKTFKK